MLASAYLCACACEWFCFLQTRARDVLANGAAHNASLGPSMSWYVLHSQCVCVCVCFVLGEMLVKSGSEACRVLHQPVFVPSAARTANGTAAIELLVSVLLV